MSLSKSAKYYRDNKEARDKKKKYDTKLNERPEQRAKRSLLVKVNRDAQKKGTAKIGDNKDFSHTKNGLVQKPQSVNRGSKTDSKGDKSARGKKK